MVVLCNASAIYMQATSLALNDSHAASTGNNCARGSEFGKAVIDSRSDNYKPQKQASPDDNVVFWLRLSARDKQQDLTMPYLFMPLESG
jgi:hypothetical protein